MIDLLGVEHCGPLVLEAKALAQSISERQSAAGSWSVVVDDPSSPLESSATALIARALLILARLEVLDEKLALAGHRAARAVIECVGSDGTVLRSQGPTIWASATPPGGCWPWTQGLTLLMAAEQARHT